ncbi:MAG: ribonuclease HI family protein [Candidatus Electrothrix aestuarii]|uniref:Ribonuclease HI family protein n=1 Tax=Candidatus Electrothrix aestuarii TaxID=3062594 RepID=A0AAU8M0C4_9BACT|nr:ribonuclease HI family protein [Candidatus Electrothrix aestuarii]
MPDLDRASIAIALGEQLPDSVLAKLFPNYPLADIRAVLRGQQKTARIKTPPAQQQNLFATSSAQSASIYKLFTDGASRGNPGEAGAGSVLLDADGQELAARSAYLGQCTNNVAEYKALLLGVQSALELGCSRLEIFLDSQLIVRQLQGQYKVKHAALQPLFAEVKGLLSKLQHWTVAHVPREQNKRADELANRGIDEKGA